MPKFKNEDFVHWHAHSEYSQFDGLAKLDKLVEEARKMGFPALALTDHGNVMGWLKFLKACKEPSDYGPLKPILGCEFYLSRKMDIGQYQEKKQKKGEPRKHQPDGRKGNRHLNLYAMNYKGYRNLCTLSQKSWLEGFYSDPRIDIDLLSKHSEGIMCGSACLSSVINSNLLHDNFDKAKKVCTIFKDIFADNFHLEAMYHGIPEERAIIPDIFKISNQLEVPIIATNDCHYIHKKQAASQEIMMCMSMSRCIKDPRRIHFPYDEFYLKSAEEMGKIFGSSPQSLLNTVALAERIDTEDIEKNLFGGMRLPKFDIPEEFSTAQDYLENLAWEGLKRENLYESDKHKEALEKELKDVKVARDNNNYDFATYFLIVRDYIQKAKEQGILVGPGRGSGYASVLLKCLGITAGIDPVEHGLIWERFLGFQDLRFIKDSDFGFEVENMLLEKTDLDTDRDVEEDLGGIDRW
tara:strand:+ start:42446 stop:43843 length:1398 start_codon:yes stop_codon:yes gene_type:complete